MPRSLPLLVLLAACGGPPDDSDDRGYVSKVYSDPGAWLCHGDRDDDVCAENLDVTVVNADGSTAVQAHVPASPPYFDCFYVYPTVSADSGNNADMEPGPEERFAVLNQAARMSEVCRVFAPVYRQVTLLALADGTGDWDLAYEDVRDAWKHYLAQDNDGKGVLVIGHSQGAGMIRRLVQEEIETSDAALDPLIAAWIIGNPVAVPEGADVGGDFKRVPICRSADQYGCALTWASYREAEPPDADGLFGLPPAGQVYACTHPAALDGSPERLDGIFAASTGSALVDVIGGGTEPWADMATGTPIDTPFFSMPGFLSGACRETDDGIGYLAVQVQADPGDPRADDVGGDFLPGWGLHLVDVNVVAGQLGELARAQHQAWAARN